MIVQATSSQTVKIVLRKAPTAAKVVITNNSTRSVMVVDHGGLTINNDSYDLVINYTFGEGNFYQIKVIDLVGGVYSEIFSTVAYCTSQTINQLTDDNYTINQGEFTEVETDNEFIING